MKRTAYPIHPDFEPWSHMHPPINRAMLPATQKLMGLLFAREKSAADLQVERLRIPVSGAAIRALLYSPVGVEASAPCLIDYHGGGFVFPAAPYHYELARVYALRAGCKVLFVDYRLAPKHPFPTAPEDAYAAYVWALGHAAELGIDPHRVAVAGDSAGGTLATVVGLMAAERGVPLPCAQMLIYPAVGLAAETESMRQFTDTPMCNSRDAAKYNRLYMPDPSAGKPEYAAPLGAPSLAGQPPCYLETAEFDCLRDSGILYAQRLRDEGVPAELHNTKGTMHGFDIVLKSPIVQACIDDRVAFLQRAFLNR